MAYPFSLSPLIQNVIPISFFNSYLISIHVSIQRTQSAFALWFIISFISSNFLGSFADFWQLISIHTFFSPWLFQLFANFLSLWPKHHFSLPRSIADLTQLLHTIPVIFRENIFLEVNLDIRRIIPIPLWSYMLLPPYILLQGLLYGLDMKIMSLFSHNHAIFPYDLLVHHQPWLSMKTDKYKRWHNSFLLTCKIYKHWRQLYMETTNQPHCQKISKGVGLLWHSSKECPKNILTIIYETLVLLSFTYCCITLGFTYHTCINVLYSIKKAMRIITHFTTSSHLSPLFKQFQFSNMYQILKHQATCFMFDLLNNIFRNTYEHKFLTTNKYHSCKTRNNLSLSAHVIKLDISKNTIVHHGIKIWNILSPEL